MGKPVGLGNSPHFNILDIRSVPSLLKRSDKGTVPLKQLGKADIIIPGPADGVVDLDGILNHIVN